VSKESKNGRKERERETKRLIQLRNEKESEYQLKKKRDRKTEKGINQKREKRKKWTEKLTIK